MVENGVHAHVGYYLFVSKCPKTTSLYISIKIPSTKKKKSSSKGFSIIVQEEEEEEHGNVNLRYSIPACPTHNNMACLYASQQFSVVDFFKLLKKMRYYCTRHVNRLTDILEPSSVNNLLIGFVNRGDKRKKSRQLFHNI